MLSAANGAERRRQMMLKATKITLAALFVAGSCGLAAAQGTGTSSDSGGVSTDEPANRDTLDTSKKQQRELQGAPSGMTGSDAKMQQKDTNMPASAGPNETGTAKDAAGSGTQRNPANHKKPAHVPSAALLAPRWRFSDGALRLAPASTDRRRFLAGHGDCLVRGIVSVRLAGLRGSPYENKVPVQSTIQER
jgi:hypothetical protein